MIGWNPSDSTWAPGTVEFPEAVARMQFGLSALHVGELSSAHGKRRFRQRTTHDSETGTQTSTKAQILKAKL